MKKNITMYWPLAVVVSLAGMAYVQFCNESASHRQPTTLATDRVSAELARAVSWGMVGDATADAALRTPLHVPSTAAL